MVLAIPFPDIDPALFSIEIGSFTLSLRWYALAYIAGILLGWQIVKAAIRRPALWSGPAPMDADQADDLLTWMVLGIILGGRLGSVLFYNPGYYLAHPLEILAVWNGGMSFHGGLLGVVIALAIFGHRRGIGFVPLADCLAIATPPGLLFGRIANFINAELWGRPTDLPWGVIFPGAAAQDCPGVLTVCARHPSQLYEAALEGIVLGLLLLWLAFRRGGLKVPGQMGGLFLAGYGLARLIVEYFRQADAQFITPDNPLGLVIRLGDTGLSMGQILSLPMLLLGVAVILVARSRVRRHAGA